MWGIILYFCKQQLKIIKIQRPMYKRLILPLLLALPLIAMAQTADETAQIEEMQQHFEQFAQKNPQERVYLHFDNTSYYKGEHIWYKAYVVDDATLHPSDLSRILYVELVNPIGYPVETQKILVRNGQASGSFELKDTLNAGFYEVRAYTAWMLNFAPGNGHGWYNLTGILSKEFYGERLQHYLKGNAGIFSRVFPIYEKVEKGQYGQRRMPRLPKATASESSTPKDRLLIDFYPEGGNLVRNVATRVAFQAHTTEGRTLNIEGRLVRNGHDIGTFKTDYGGRGVFSVTTDESDEAEEEMTRGLKLKVDYNGKTYTFSLPKSQKRGYVLNVLRSGDGWRAIIARNSDTPGRQLGLSVTSRGNTLYSGVIDMRSDKEAQLKIGDTSLQTGVNIFTLYDSSGKVIAQRQVFVNNHDMDGMRLQVSMPDQAPATLQPNEKITLQCQITTPDGTPVTGRNKFSLAVTDNQFHDGTYADGNVLSYLLLSSEVKGFIPHPEYYFESDDNEHRAALDQLLMVQGWTRYDFERMMSGKKWEPLMAIERGLNFRGRVVDDHGQYQYALWKNLKKPMWVYNEAVTPYDGIVTSEIKTDSLGFFMFNITPFFGTARFSLTLNEQSAKTIGQDKAGVAGHSFNLWQKRVPIHMLDKHIIPLNAYSPIARNYDYYETWALNDDVDKNIFRTGMMASLPSPSGGMSTYDPNQNAYILREVTKVKKRHWADLSHIKPAAVIDVRDMMTYLSNIFGSINDFHFYKSTGDNFTLVGNDEQAGGWWHPGNERDDIVQDNFADDRLFSDMWKYRKESREGKDDITPTTTKEAKKVNSQRVYNKLQGYDSYKFDYTYWSYYNYYKILMLLGIDGMNYTMMDAETTEPGVTYVSPGHYGYGENLPEGMKFFPKDFEISQLQVYVDAEDRSLIHQEGRYREVLEHFQPSAVNSDAYPLTSIFNFKSDELYSRGMPTPDFYGYRINFQGLSEPDEFYNVDYSREPLPEEGDYRRTIYWNPNVLTDESGHTQVTFYNNSYSKSVSVSAEGLGDNGFIITQKQ